MNVERAADIGKLGASMLALLSCQDVGIAIKTSCNAVENNFIPAAIGIGFVAWEGYDIYCTARDEGVEAAVIKLGFDVAVAATGLYTGKRVYQLGKIIAPTAAEALLQYKQAHPLFAKCYDQAASVIGKGVEKYKVLDAKLEKQVQKLLTKEPNPTPKNIALHEQHKVELRREMQAPHVEDVSLKELFRKLYRENAKVGHGSTAEAIRHEIRTGELVGARSHMKKGNESIEFLKKWLESNSSASSKDRSAAENVLSDLIDSLNTKK